MTLKNLTREELSLLPSFFDNRWLPLNRMTGPPTDPQAAFDAVKELCRRVRRPVPKQAVWQIGRPRNNSAITCSRQYPCAACVLERLRDRKTVLLSEEMRRQLDGVFRPRIREPYQAWLRLHGVAAPRAAHSVVMAFMGEHPVEFDFLDQIGRKRFEFVRAWRQISMQAGGWYFAGDSVIFTQRPNLVVRNELGQLSNADGPAVVYSDGSTLYAWRDRPILANIQPAYFMQYNGMSIVDGILNSSFSTRDSALAIDMYGTERFLREVPNRYKRMIDSSKWGMLWHVTSKDGRETRMFVEVKNSSGRGETHVIPVDPWLRPLGSQQRIQAATARQHTALQAIASTFGMNAEEYARIVEA